MCVLGIEFRPSGGAVCAPHHGANSSALSALFGLSPLDNLDTCTDYPASVHTMAEHHIFTFKIRVSLGSCTLLLHEAQHHEHLAYSLAHTSGNE